MTTPVVVKKDFVSDAKAKVASVADAARDGLATPESPEVLVAAGITFELPAAWGHLGAGAASREAGAAAEGAGTVVSAVCPAGVEEGSCAGGAKLMVFTYSGREGRSLPVLSLLERQLDDQLARQYKGFAPNGATTHTSSDGSIRYLSYTFTRAVKGSERKQRLAAFRHEDGSGVVIVGSGANVAGHASAIDEFLQGASGTLMDEASA